MPDLNERIALAAERLGVVAAERRHVVVTAESCTGGGIAAAITEVPGSSAWFREGFVTYAAEAKTSLLDVDPKMIEEEGVVSEDVAQAMARGALARSRSMVRRATVLTALEGLIELMRFGNPAVMPCEY